MTFFTKLIWGALLSLLLTFQALAQTSDEDVDGAAVSKMNAYVSLLNRAIRASDSLERYDSWVDMKKGPTGKERIIYGMYSPYDVRDEIAQAQQAIAAEPKMPALDSAMQRFIEAYENLAPVLDKASKYYDRLDYKSDKMQGGKEYHAKIAEYAPVYVKAREEADALVTEEKRVIDQAQLAAIEKAQGKKALWHVRNVMMKAQAVVDVLPDADKPVVDMPKFDTILKDYAGAVREMDDYASDHPNSFHVFESSPASLLSKLREFQEKLQKTKGDARKGSAAGDLQWIVNDYNMMVTTSQSATEFAND